VLQRCGPSGFGSNSLLGFCSLWLRSTTAFCYLSGVATVLDKLIFFTLGFYLPLLRALLPTSPYFDLLYWFIIAFIFSNFFRFLRPWHLWLGFLTVKILTARCPHQTTSLILRSYPYMLRWLALDDTPATLETFVWCKLICLALLISSPSVPNPATSLYKTGFSQIPPQPPKLFLIQLLISSNLCFVLAIFNKAFSVYSVYFTAFGSKISSAMTALLSISLWDM